MCFCVLFIWRVLSFSISCWGWSSYHDSIEAFSLVFWCICRYVTIFFSSCVYFFACSFASCAFYSFLFLINIWVFVASDQLIELDDSLWIFIEPDLVSNFFSLSLKSNRIYKWWMSIICNCFYFLYFVLVFPFLICSNLSNQWI